MHDTDISKMNFTELIVHYGTTAGVKDRPFIMFRNDLGIIESVSYHEYYQKSLVYGRLLLQIKQQQKMKDQERFHVGVFTQNIPEFLYILGGCAFTNSTLVGINSAQKGKRLAFDINTIDIKVLFVDRATQPGTNDTFIETVLKAKESVGFTTLSSDFIFTSMNSSQHHLVRVSDNTDVMTKISPTTSHHFQPEDLKINNAGVIIFTSGTTGVPKGIEVSWKKLIDVGITATRILDYTEKDVGYVCMPVSHSNALYLNIMPAFINNARILLRRRFSVSNFVKDIEAVKATVWNCVGDPVQYILNYLFSQNHINKSELSKLPLRTVISTGTNATNRTLFSHIFGLQIFKEVYGATETGAITAVDETTPHYSVGKLLKDIRVINEDTLEECNLAEVNDQGKIVNLENCAGEIIVNQSSLGASAFSGYYKLPEESSQKLITRHEQEFYRLGDLGAIVRIENEKYLIFLGRTGDWIRYKGENWAPIDGERIINSYETINNVGIIGVPQATGKEDDPLYVIEVAQPSDFELDKFLVFCQENLPHYMLPRFVRIVKILPMTETMKLKKAILKYEFYFRNQELDTNQDDLIFKISKRQINRFTTDEYKKELSYFTDPTNQDTLQTYTKRQNLF